MATSDLVSLMEREREKYRAQRDRARTELEEAERWLHKIDTFLAAEVPRPPRGAGEKQKSARTRKPREETAKVRQDVLDAIRQNPATGLAAKDLYGMLEPHGYKRSGINAALFALSKEGAIQQSGRRQPYTLAGAGAAPAPNTETPPPVRTLGGSPAEEEPEEAS